MGSSQVAQEPTLLPGFPLWVQEEDEGVVVRGRMGVVFCFFWFAAEILSHDASGLSIYMPDHA